MQHRGDRARRGGNKKKSNTASADMCVCVCSGTECLTLLLLVLDRSLEKPEWFFKDYMEDDASRKMWLYGSNGAFVSGDAWPVRSLCTVTCGR